MVGEIRSGRNAILIVLGLALCFVTHAALASTVVVGGCKPTLTSFTTIQKAVDSNLSTGGVIDVCPGTYAEQVVISKNLKLTGLSGIEGAAIIVPPASGLVQNGTDNFSRPVAAQVFVSNAVVTISNLTVDGAGNNVADCGLRLNGIYFQNSSGSITNDVVRNQYQTDYANFGGCQNGFAIYVESLTNSASVTISNNSVRSYQKNGISAVGAKLVPSQGPTVTISNNHVVGLAATAMNWQAGATAAENGIEVAFGATGKVINNTVTDNIWGPGAGNGASGILVYASPNVSITGNEVASAQYGIATASDAQYGPADGTVITGNKIAGTQLFDGIDVCSNSNTVQSNTIFGSAESGVHIDDSCGATGNNNVITKNTINEACAGVLKGNGTGNAFTPNTLMNVHHTLLSGNSCQ